jgi:hypothetical protein
MGTIATVTIGADTFSVYAKTADALADATTFFNAQLGTGKNAWATAGSSDKLRSLVMAADWIDRGVGPVFSGTKTVDNQPREWPRDGATCYSESIPNGTTPDALADAEFWLAGAILADNNAAAGTGTGSNVKKAKAGSAEVTFFSATLGSPNDTRLPQVAHDYVKCFFDQVTSLGFASGVDGESAFCPTDFTRVEGYP